MNNININLHEYEQQLRALGRKSEADTLHTMLLMPYTFTYDEIAQMTAQLIVEGKLPALER